MTRGGLFDFLFDAVFDAVYKETGVPPDVGRSDIDWDEEVCNGDVNITVNVYIDHDKEEAIKKPEPEKKPEPTVRDCVMDVAKHDCAAALDELAHDIANDMYFYIFDDEKLSPAENHELNERIREEVKLYNELLQRLEIEDKYGL